jgi:hypothetical protein
MESLKEQNILHGLDSEVFGLATLHVIAETYYRYSKFTSWFCFPERLISALSRSD